jgi:hypothetical protein
METTETNRTFSKQTETALHFLKIPKYALYQIVSVGLLFISIQSKHQNSLFRYTVELKKLTQTVSKQTKTNRNNPNFCEKNTKYDIYHTVSVTLLFCFGSMETPNSLIWYRS